MTDLELSITTADRILTRAENGVVTFRLMSAAEEPHVLRALHHWRGLAYEVPDLLQRIRDLEADLLAARQRTADYLNV